MQTTTTLTPRPMIKPQDGFQVQYLASGADIVIGGAAAGVGKSWCLLVAPLRHKDVRRFNCIIFRRTTEQIRNPGGLWDKSTEIYPKFGIHQNEQQLEWYISRSNVTIKFSHLQYEKNIYDHDGTEYALIEFDELQTFTRKQFFYLLSRNRSTCGVKPYVLATCNPDPDSFLAEMLEWWIDQDEKIPDYDANGNKNTRAGEKNPHWGFPIEDRIGIIRYLVVHEEQYIWGESKDALIRDNPAIFTQELLSKVENPHDLIKSVTLITGSIFDNKELLAINPSYLGNLMAQDDVEKLRLLHGNWKVRGKDSCIFNSIAITNLFDNPWPANTTNRYITCDAARFGDDMCTIFVWYGWKVVKLIILTKSDKDEIIENIERERERYTIPKNHVIVDQDGVGGGVVRDGRYIGFGGGLPPMEEPGTFIKENYFNLKTQFAYRLADKVNIDEVSLAVSSESIMVDGVYSAKIKVKNQVHDVRDLIKQDFRAIRSKDKDKDGKKKINDKSEQKTLLFGRSPDFFDGMNPRIYFEFKSGKITTSRPSKAGSLLDRV